MAVNAYAQYQENQINTASPGALLVMAYDGAIRFSRMAIEKMRAGDLYWQNEYIKKAQAIVLELMATINPEPNPELALNLAQLYEYIVRRMMEANVQSDEAILAEVIKLLTDLREAWAQAAASQPAGAGVGA